MQDRSLSFDRLRAANEKRCEEVFHKVDSWSPTDWATALAGEVGEACNEIKKLRRLDGADASQDTAEKREELRMKIGVELADVIAYADLLAARLGINLGDQVISKFNEVSKKRNSTVFL
jgi:NTP pyrophosphatase (non-canonical NTP hydrolase)